MALYYRCNKEKSTGRLEAYVKDQVFKWQFKLSPLLKLSFKRNRKKLQVAEAILARQYGKTFENL